MEAVKRHDLIALQARRLVHGLGVAPLEPEAAFGPDHEEGQALMNPIEPAEVQTGAVHDIDRPRLDLDLVVAVVAFDTVAKFVCRQEVHEL